MRRNTEIFLLLALLWPIPHLQLWAGVFREELPHVVSFVLKAGLLGNAVAVLRQHAQGLLLLDCLAEH